MADEANLRQDSGCGRSTDRVKEMIQAQIAKMNTPEAREFFSFALSDNLTDELVRMRISPAKEKLNG